MNGFSSVFKRELKGYFATPLAYVFLVLFLFAAGIWPFWQKFFEMRQADMRLFFSNLPWLFIFMVPCVAMRLWAEERKTGSIELLFTLPITVTQAVLGKFMAAWLFLLIALLLTVTMPITVMYLGSPDVGTIIIGYLAAFLMAGAFLAIGCFFSALTKNQVISFILSAATLAVLVVVSLPTTMSYLADILPASLIPVVEGMSILEHFESMQRGLVRLSDILYFVFLIISSLIGSAFVLEERRAA